MIRRSSRFVHLAPCYVQKTPLINASGGGIDQDANAYQETDHEASLGKMDDLAHQSIDHSRVEYNLYRGGVAVGGWGM